MLTNIHISCVADTVMIIRRRPAMKSENFGNYCPACYMLFPFIILFSVLIMVYSLSCWNLHIYISSEFVYCVHILFLFVFCSRQL